MSVELSIIVPAYNVENYLAIPEVAAVGGTWLNKCDASVIRQAAEVAKKYVK